MSRVLPILFNTDMVRAILDGRKAVTRRKIPIDFVNYCDIDTDGTLLSYENDCGDFIEPKKLCPYQPGNILYIRETWERFDCCSCEGDEHGNCPKEPKKSVLDKYGCGCYMYRATDEISGDAKWHPSIHMPKKAARIWLKVKDVRVERLQDMPHDGPLKEGIQYDECPTGFTWKQETDMHNCYTTPMGAMQALWDSTINKSDVDRYGWDANPLVWVIEFERCEKPERV
ncbi:MAG: hypothetical protein ACOCM4_14455 [Acetivibrio ethanolgignens]